ncbi:hypothetical protein M422DRAFT_245555 [Sphaerobolus stellatus SS14]|nr:hypothetical protein M422DRAFT_245555 [Sphaerobolus stellatus SS14]
MTRIAASLPPLHFTRPVQGCAGGVLLAVTGDAQPCGITRRPGLRRKERDTVDIPLASQTFARYVPRRYRGVLSPTPPPPSCIRQLSQFELGIALFLSALTPTYSSMTEPYDVRIQIADKITVRQDLLNLSETCQIVRLATILVLFRTVTFAGSGGNFTRTHGQCFFQLYRTRALIALCTHNKAILSAIRHVRIIYWSGIFNGIWMRQNLEGGSTDLLHLPDYSAVVESDGPPPPPYEDSPTSFRRSLHKFQTVVYQDLADLIRLAPILQSVTVFDEEAQRPSHFDMRWKPSEFRKHWSSFPWRWGTSLRYNWIELDVRGHLRPQDPTQVILSTPLPLSTPLDKQPDTAK